MDQGTRTRTTAATHMNANSSRSHMLIILQLKQVRGSTCCVSVSVLLHNTHPTFRFRFFCLTAVKIHTMLLLEKLFRLKITNLISKLFHPAPAGVPLYPVCQKYCPWHYRVFLSDLFQREHHKAVQHQLGGLGRQWASAVVGVGGWQTQRGHSHQPEPHHPGQCNQVRLVFSLI